MDKPNKTTIIFGSLALVIILILSATCWRLSGRGRDGLFDSSSIARAHETANRIKCAVNFRQIGQAILLYSHDNSGAYPPDLGTLVKTEDITIDAFVCPSTSVHPPLNMSPNDAANWINQNSDYVYIGANLTGDVNSTAIVCYEKDENHGGDGMNLLFGDGSVQWFKLDEAHKYINDKIGPKGNGL